MLTTIIKASDASIPEIQKVANIAFPETYKTILTADQIDYMMEMMYSTANLNKQFAEGHEFYIAYHDEEPVGFVSYNKVSDALFHLQKLYVLPTCQGTGLGRKLITLAFQAVKLNNEDKKITLELNVNRQNKALHFYEKMGMKNVRTEDNNIGSGYEMNDYVMSITL